MERISSMFMIYEGCWNFGGEGYNTLGRDHGPQGNNETQPGPTNQALSDTAQSLYQTLIDEGVEPNTVDRTIKDREFFVEELVRAYGKLQRQLPKSAEQATVRVQGNTILIRELEETIQECRRNGHSSEVEEIITHLVGSDDEYLGTAKGLV